MSEYINNREYRQKVLKDLILELHQGKSAEEVKSRFEELIDGVSVMEITEMEQALIREGMAVEEVQRLCDVHASVFKGSIDEIHRTEKPEDTPGHPVHTFRLENTAVEKLIGEAINPLLDAYKRDGGSENLNRLGEEFKKLLEIDKHYLRKENLLFPFMEKYGITAPPKVMWGVDDEIRAMIKGVIADIGNYSGDQASLLSKAEEAAVKVSDMVFKEENILFPMVLETLSEDEWRKIALESDDLGYCLIKPEGRWLPERVDVQKKEEQKGNPPSNDGYIEFETGILNPEEISGLLNTLPLDITFVDKDGAVKYFSQGKERIFPRTKSIIGRAVQNCHPPASVHIVEKIAEDLKSGKKEHEDFWIKMGDTYAYIRYFAVRNEKGEFLGILEVTQDIKPIQEITGEKRLLSE